MREHTNHMSRHSKVVCAWHADIVQSGISDDDGTTDDSPLGTWHYHVRDLVLLSLGTLMITTCLWVTSRLSRACTNCLESINEIPWEGLDPDRSRELFALRQYIKSEAFGARFGFVMVGYKVDNHVLIWLVHVIVFLIAILIPVSFLN